MFPTDALLTEALPAAQQRLQRTLAESAPFLAEQVWPWLQQLAPATAQAPLATPAEYFTAPQRFPYLQLPWWMAQTIRPQPALPFQTDVVYATLNGHYFEQLVAHAGRMGLAPTLLPAAAFFHTQFQLTYARHFAAVHPFWDRFAHEWAHVADVSARAASLRAVSLEMFRRYTSQTFCAIKIPLAAVGYHYGRVELLEPWSRCAEALSAWHQLWQEVFTDPVPQPSYFYSEAQQRRQPTETTAAWVEREGRAWGQARLREWLADVRQLAQPLHSPALLAYLAHCERRVQHPPALAQAA